MASSAWMLIAAQATNHTLFGSRSLAIAVWVGLAVLTVALLVLMRTRWGQVQPISKCVALSVFAHVLLFVYAYGTHLFVTPPLSEPNDVIQLTEFQATPAGDPEQQATADQPWEAFPAEQPVVVDADAPDRAAPVPDPVTRTTAIAAWDAAGDALPSDALPAAELARAVADRPLPPEYRAPASFVQPAAIMTPIPVDRGQAEATFDPVPAPPADPVWTMTKPADLPRTQPLTRPVAPNLPSELVDVGSRMQQLADLASPAATADALASSHDDLAEATNQAPGTIDSSGVAATRRSASEPPPDNLVTLPTRPRAIAGSVPAAMVEQVLQQIPRRLADGQPIPEYYRARTSPQRQALAPHLGGSAATENAVDAALAWLAAHQETDGRWDPDRWGAGFEKQIAGHDRGGAGANADTGITGLAILAFLANGQTHLEGHCRKNVQLGLEFLLRSQATDGNLSGHARLFAVMYCHGMASLALSEAYAMTGDVRIRPYVERAVQYTVDAQHPVSGGWRYQPGDQGDMSQFGWQVMSLKSASLAGIPIPPDTHRGMIHFVSRCALGQHDGLACYQPGRPASRPMTAESLACRYFLDLPPDAPLLQEATEFLLGELPQAGTANLYYWYYGSLALFQVQGDPWQRWNEPLQRQLLRSQRSDGPFAGSWDPDTVWGCYGGRVYSTALAALCLEVYYRYLPLAAAQPAATER